MVSKADYAISDGLLGELGFGEGQQRKFVEARFLGSKLPSSFRNELADHIASIANARGGDLYLGVDIQGEVCGSTRKEIAACERAVDEACRDFITPPLTGYSTHLRSAGDAHVLLVRIESSSLLHESPGGTLRRSGCATTWLGLEDQARLSYEKSLRYHGRFDAQILQPTGINSLNCDWKHLLNGEDRDFPFTPLENLGILRCGLGNQLCATVAGMLVFGRRPQEHIPHAYISAAKYDGEDRSAFVLDKTDCKGTLVEQIKSACSFVFRNMKVAQRKDAGPGAVQEYSNQAVFDAIVNAVAHRDYSIAGSQIRLSMFSDRMEICSPGSLPDSLTITNIGRMRCERNILITDLLSRINFRNVYSQGPRISCMSRRGDGVPMIMNSTSELCGKLPTYSLLDGFELQLAIPAAYIDTEPGDLHLPVQAGGRPAASAPS